jgi:spermidine synthase
MFPLLVLLFAASGCCALIYEVVWFQMLQLAIGSTSVSFGILLATFMGGLCIGSLWYPRWKNPGWHPLRMYAFIELGIAVCGVLVLYTIPLIDRIYIAGTASGFPSMLLRAFFCAVCLLPPTILMGASLPAISRWIESSPQSASWWGFLYGGNTVGAVFGCLLAGFYLLRLYDVGTASYVAVGINAAIGLISLALARRIPAHYKIPAAKTLLPEPAANDWPVYVTIALSGACALGSEVIWTRLLGALLGLTVYAFAIILAVFLVGLAIGSGAASFLAREIRPRVALGWCQLLAIAGMSWTAYAIARSLPYLPIDPMLARNPWHTMQLDMARCFWAILPAPLLWGASFPLALAAVAAPGKDSGRVVGSVYAANTLGTIFGALATSLLLVPWIGTQDAQRVLLVLAAASGLVILAPHVRKTGSLGAASLLAASVVVALMLTSRVPQVSGGMIMWGRQLMTLGDESKIIYTEEGRNSSVAVAQLGNGALYVGVNGHVEATTEEFDMKLQRMVGHLPALLHPNPKSILGIGFGAGVSAGTFTRYPGIEKITICEIEPVIPPTSTRFLGQQNYRVALDPRTRIVYDDARHYLMTTTEKFDIIASDPLDVFAKGTAALYTVEYFEAVKRHLNPGGFFTLYVPLYESDFATVKSELATFFEAFPNATVWNNTLNGRGYDMVFLGQAEPLRIDLDEVYGRLDRPDYAQVALSLRAIGFFTPLHLFATYTGTKSDLGEWVRGSPLNRDRDLRLQYMAGWGINSRLENEIYMDMMRYRRNPMGIFQGSAERMSALMQVLAAP